MNLEAKDVFILELCRPQAFSFPVQAGQRNVLVSKQSSCVDTACKEKEEERITFFKRFFPETHQYGYFPPKYQVSNTPVLSFDLLTAVFFFQQNDHYNVVQFLKGV